MAKRTKKPTPKTPKTLPSTMAGVTPRKTSLAIDRGLWARLRIQAIREGKPAYHILNELIQAYLAQQEGK